MTRNGFTLMMASLVLLSSAASQAIAQAPAQCPSKCPTYPDTSKMVPISAYGTVIFFEPIGRAYYHQGKKYAVLNDKNEAVLVPADAPPGETLPGTVQATTGQAAVSETQPAGGGAVAPADAGVPQPATGEATQSAGAQAPVAQSAPTTQVASARSATSAPVSASVLESPKSEQSKPQAPLAKGVTTGVKDPVANLVAVKTPLADQPVNVANAAELARLDGRWRASVRDFLGNTTVIEMELQDLANDPSATLISQTTGQPPSESKRKVAFTDNKLTLTDGADVQVLGQIAEASTVRLRITGATGDMLFTRSPAD